MSIILGRQSQDKKGELRMSKRELVTVTLSVSNTYTVYKDSETMIDDASKALVEIFKANAVETAWLEDEIKIEPAPNASEKGMCTFLLENEKEN